MRPTAVLVALVLVAAMGVAERPAAATPGGQAWVRRYNDLVNGPDFAKSVRISTDNFRLYVTGTSWGGKAKRADYVTIAYSRAGAWLWSRRYNGSGSGDDLAAALSRSPDGSRIFVTGSSWGGKVPGYGYATVAYSSGGTRLWTRRYDGLSHGFDFHAALSITVSADGSRVYVTGTSPGLTSEDYATVAYDAATGAQLWAARYDSGAGADDVAFSVAVSRDGTRVYATGGGPAFGPPSSMTTIAYDAATGAQLWAQQFVDPGADDAASAGLAVSRDGTRVYVTGGREDNTGPHAVTIAYDNNGTQLWEKESEPTLASAVALSRDGSRVYVGGTIKPEGS